MESTQNRPQDLTPAGKRPDLSLLFYQRIKSSPSTAKVATAAKPPCSVNIEEIMEFEHYPLRSRTRSASKAASLDVSGRAQGNADRVNGARLINHITAPKQEALQVLSKVDDSQVLNVSSITPVLSAVELGTSANLIEKNNMKIGDQSEFMETIQHSTPVEPMLCRESSSIVRRVFIRTRSSSVRNLISAHGKEEKPDEGSNKTPIGRPDVDESVKNWKRSREEEDVGELESTCKNKKDNVGNLLNLDEVRSAISRHEDVSRKKVKRALQLFHTIYNKLSQEAEAGPKPKFEYHKSRFDLTAWKLLRERNLELKLDSSYIGSVPGVEVGDEFHLRVELSMLGIHRQLQAGVDYSKQDGRLLARSIISSDSSKYTDNGKNSDVLIYSGSGSPNKNQKLECGNLALKNSIDAQNLIRVIWGFEDFQIANSKSSKGKKSIRYIYDGLYLAEKFWVEKNDSDFDIFMFQLRRQKQQPELKLKKVKLRTSISFSDICVEDISDGREKVPISAVNTIDEESPEPFTYTKDIIYPLKYTPIPPKGCSCSGVCADSIECACAVKNGDELPFNSRGCIVQAKPLVYECGPSCNCSSSCHNRVSQHGIKYPLEVFKTESMGWGLRSLSFITSGSFVCEYAGELIQDEDAQKRTNDEYLFAIGNNYHDAALWEGLPTSIPELQKRSSSEIDELTYTVDASNFGNVARFINHSCMPNLYAQNLLFDHGNKSMPHIMLFASEDIPPLQELTYHYNYTLGQVHDSNGNIKEKVCHCGTVECTGRLY